MSVAATRIGCAPNFRDFGGFPTRSGRKVRRGRLFRSEAIVAPGEEDAARLAAAGIRLVCDLRGGQERRSAPNHFWAGAGVELLEMDVAAGLRAPGDPLAMLADGSGVEGARRLMIETYRGLPAAGAPHLRTLFRRLAGGAQPVLIHCTAGKDRTGFVAAMVLHALDVAADEIITDYLASGRHPHPTVVEATRRIMEDGIGAPISDAALDVLVGVDARYLEASLAAIRENHGSIERYLEETAGLSRAIRHRLHEALVV